MNNILLTGVSFVCLVLMLVGCVASPPDVETSTIVLFAPFEGRYRDVGYQALYASQLALTQHESNIEILAIDMGVTVESTIERAGAIALHDDVVVVALGYNAVDPRVLSAFDDMPVVISGYWGELPSDATVISSNQEIIANLQDTLPAIYSLPSFYETLSGVETIQIASSARLPDDAFRRSYLGVGEFVPEPSLIATQTYDVFVALIDHFMATSTRPLDGDIFSHTTERASVFIYALDTRTGELTALDVIVEDG